MTIGGQSAGAVACTTIQPARLDEVWCSIAGLLRVGDLLRLRWRAGDTIDALTGAGLYRDELRIAVQRGQREWVFLLDVAVRTTGARTITLAAP